MIFFGHFCPSLHRGWAMMMTIKFDDADVDKQQSMIMDDLLQNIYNDHSHASPSVDGGASASNAALGRTMEEVWKDIIVAGRGGADWEDKAEGDADHTHLICSAQFFSSFPHNTNIKHF